MSCESPSQWNGNEEKESKSWKSPLGKNKLKKNNHVKNFVQNMSESDQD
jgi:hypothetical protein